MGRRERQAAEYRRHHDNASEHIESALEELAGARRYFPIQATAEDFLRRALAITRRQTNEGGR